MARLYSQKFDNTQPFLPLDFLFSLNHRGTSLQIFDIHKLNRIYPEVGIEVVNYSV